jgi:hypothetical protein
MSLDISLYGPERTEPCRCPHCDNEHTRLTRDEYFEANITHNLYSMAQAAGVYDHVWRPDEHGITKAAGLIPALEVGIRRLKANPAEFKVYDAPNGWGTYRDFVPWLERLLAACTAVAQC